MARKKNPPDHEEPLSGSNSNAPVSGDDSSSQSVQNSLEIKAPVKTKRASQYFLLALLFISSLAFVPIIGIFLVPIILATTLVILFYPFYSMLLRLFRGNRPISSLICCLVLVIGLLIPLIIIINIVLQQMLTLYSTAEPTISDIITKGSNSQIIQNIMANPAFEWIRNLQFDWQSVLTDITRRITDLGTLILNKTSRGLFGIAATLVITLFTMFYFFMDGKKIVQRIRFLSPIKSEYQDLIITRFKLISKATISGTLIIGTIQGTLGAISLLIFGIDSWLLWGFIMTILAIIPMAGAWLILIPAGIIQLILGNVWQGIGILLSSIVVVSNIDNIIRPRIVGHGAKMHDLLIFFSTLGGIALFGVMGFIIGPFIASFFITMVDIYEIEFRKNLELFERS